LNRLSFDFLDSCISYAGLKFRYSFETYHYFIARCTLIAQPAGLMLLRVT